MENSGRLASAEIPTPRAHTTPSSTASMSRATRMCPHPARLGQCRRSGTGRWRPETPAPAIHEARNFPHRICPGRSRVTCRMARVPAARSPLMALAEKAGATSRPNSSTKASTSLKDQRPRARAPAMHPRPYWLVAGLRLPAPPGQSRDEPDDANQMPSMMYQPRERSRWRSSMPTTANTPST